MSGRPWRGWDADRVIDLACIGGAGFLGLAVAGDAEASGRVTGTALFWSLVVGGLGCITLWWRRRHPVHVAVLLAPVALITEIVGGAVLVAVFTVAAYRRLSVALAVAGLHIAAAVPYSLARPDPDLTPIGANVLNVALLSVAVSLGVILRSRRDLMASLRERAARAEAEARMDAERIRALERERIAREMHDALAHRISLVSLHAGALQVRPDLSAGEVARAADTIRSNAHQALEDLREILGVLRGPSGADLRPPPGLAGIEALIMECRTAGAPVEVERRLPEADPPAAVSRTAYRIVQEGLTNARKHAPGAAVRLTLDRTSDGELHVWLRNPLPRTDVAALPGARSGLVGLSERVGLVGGRLQYGARRDPDAGIAFHLEAWLPWPG